MEIPSIYGQTSLEVVVPKLLILCAKYSEFPFWSLIFLNLLLMVLKLWKVKVLGSHKGGPYKMMLRIFRDL